MGQSTLPKAPPRRGRADRLARGLALAVAGLLAGAAVLAEVGCASDRIDDRVVPIVESAAVVQAGQRADRAALLVDVRTPTTFAAGHLPGAVNIRLSDLRFNRFVDRLRSSPAIIVYGQNPGDASAMAMAKRLISMGMERVSLFAGGYDAWSRRGGGG